MITNRGAFHVAKKKAVEEQEKLVVPEVCVQFLI